MAWLCLSVREHAENITTNKMRLFYLLSVRLYAFTVRVASLWSPKAKAWVKGRQNVWSEVSSWKRNPEIPVYWFHCASLGEFEQGRPLMERLKKEGDCQLVITFFSPSGYSIRKNYELADLVIYLPHETGKNVNRFYETVQPNKIFFVKYEFWATFILTAKKRQIPIYSISAVFRENQFFFKSYGGYMRKVLKAFDTIFVQEMTSKKLLESIQIQSVLAGDTRYDRVMENAKNVKSIPMVSDFVKDKKVFIMGSSWSVGEEVIFPSIDKLSSDWKVIIAPHEIHEAHIVEIEKKLNKETIRFSKLEEIHDGSADILIIDNIGMLMHLYQYADIAYVGGAFGSGLHNVLEPACFGVPVIFGPKHDKFREAQDFIDHEIGYAIEDRSAFDSIFSDLQRQDKKRAIQNFMKDRTGATEIIYEGIA